MNGAFGEAPWERHCSQRLCLFTRTCTCVMGSKTLTITEEAYNRLKAEKREDESFTETITRILGETHSDWRRGFGRYSGADGEELERVVTHSKRGVGEGLARGTDRVLESMGFELDENGNVVASPDDATADTDESR